MENNKCAINHLDSDALLPPRKRLLAGLKKQSYDTTFPAPSTPFNDCDTHLNYLLRSHFSNPNLSNEEILAASNRAAIEAAKVAEAARANAEEKAAKAAKAMTAAKTALDLVATLEEKAAKKEKSLKKNKMKKHLPVQALYNNKKKGNTNCRRDEEVARNLHRAINSSPRISKSSDSKNDKHKKLKSNGSSVVEVDMIMVDLNTSKPETDDDEGRLENDNVGIVMKDKFAESDSFGKKRAKIKQKKLPLSICNFRDQSSPKEEMKIRSIQNGEDNQDVFSVESSGNNSLIAVERTSLWKCQAFKAPVCVPQSKVMQS